MEEDVEEEEKEEEEEEEEDGRLNEQEVVHGAGEGRNCFWQMGSTTPTNGPHLTAPDTHTHTHTPNRNHKTR